MKRKSSVKSSELALTSVPAFWPMAMATAMIEEGAELYAKNLNFVEEEIKIHDELRPNLATPNTVRAPRNRDSETWGTRPWPSGASPDCSSSTR